MFVNQNVSKQPLLVVVIATKRQYGLIDEPTEAELEIGRQTLHRADELPAEKYQLVLVVLHRFGQIHQIIQIDRVVHGP